MTADDAVSYGLIDAVIAPRRDRIRSRRRDPPPSIESTRATEYQIVTPRRRSNHIASLSVTSNELVELVNLRTIWLPRNSSGSAGRHGQETAPPLLFALQTHVWTQRRRSAAHR